MSKRLQEYFTKTAKENNYTYNIHLTPFAYDLNPEEHNQRNKSSVFPQNKQLNY